MLIHAMLLMQKSRYFQRVYKLFLHNFNRTLNVIVYDIILQYKVVERFLLVPLGFFLVYYLFVHKKCNEIWKKKLERQRRKGLISSLDHSIEQRNRSKCELQLQQLLQATDRLFIKPLRQDAPQISFAGFIWKSGPAPSGWGKSNCREVLSSLASVFIFTLYFKRAAVFSTKHL